MTDTHDLILTASVVPGRGHSARAVGAAVAAARAGALPVIDVADADGLAATRRSFADAGELAFAIAPTGGLLAADPAVLGSDLDLVDTIVLTATAVAEVIGYDDDGSSNFERSVAVVQLVTRWATLGRVLVEVLSKAEAERAIAAGAAGLVAKGCESGGLVGDTESFVLLQQVVDLGVPVWVRGGIGLHTAAGAVAAGARGVVLDAALALVHDNPLPSATRAAIAAMDGSETRVIGRHRLFSRPDLPVASLPDDLSPTEIARDLGPDVRRDLVPLGQDAPIAALLADRYRTTGAAVAAIRTAVDSHLAAARSHRPLEPGGGIATSHGMHYPIAQGPMTRVSDRPAFAAAVADAGGLPFLALALLPGREVEPLLEETAELLGDRPWGVGILGFVPPELRAEQLDVVARVGPPVALIAGGRPSQAAPLEEAGTATYLHVPSPGLLDRFLKDGARRFVFEGRECGGHVGPRASFPLWEAQVARLCEVADAEALHVLFAGGIHDARSAAAAAAIGAPLAARGAKLGVLMGTAYLFTHESVRAGAITPAFQDVAVSCNDTVLLETSPGHATRCVDTDYAQAFAETSARLVAEGVPTKERWLELESLNLGRLRVASKGLVHGDDGLVEVDDAIQRREGMFMIGQVATLRDQVVSIAELHEEVAAGSTTRLDGLATRQPVPARDVTPRPLDIAIVGMASMFPGSSSTDEFWASIVAGTNAIREVPSTRWQEDLYFDPAATTEGAGRKTPSKWGGFLSEVGFDPLAYGIPPASLAAIEPLQLLSLEVAARALADAGYATREFDRSRAAVVFGAEGGNDLAGAYGLRAMLPQLVGDIPPELDRFLPALTEDSFPGVLTNVIAGRIANRLDLGGMNFTIDAACAASLAALDAACKELVAGNSDMVLCGGADAHNGINDYLLFSSVHALSPTGQCRTFDASADGIALGEGVACLVLKRRVDAERDGDRIYAVIDAVAGSSDGRHLGLTAPRKEGQQLALERAYAQAGRSPAELGLVEAHGTGTVVGDRTELATLTEIFDRNGADTGACVLGSVKSQIGHTKCAAGLAGLIKAAQAIYHGVLPATGNLVSPNPAYDAETSPFRFIDQPRPWIDGNRHAGVSAFGFGGANFHAVLSGHEGGSAPAHGVESWPAELFLVRAGSFDQALGRLDQLSTLLDEILEQDPAGRRHRLRDLAATVSATGRGPVQVAIVATDLHDLADKVVVARSGTARRDGVFLADAGQDPQGPAEHRTAFLYPGQGSQRTGMLLDLFVTFPQLRDVLVTGSRWVDVLYPRTAFDPETRAEQTEAITDTRVAQPTLGMCGLAVTRLLADCGVRPGATAGHSYGELVALAAAGVLDPADLLDLSEARGEAILAAAAECGDDPGAMAAVSAPIDDVRRALERHPDVVVANHNSPSQAVISGPTAAVAALIDDLSSTGLAAKRINVAAAFHSPLLHSAPDRLAAELDAIAVTAPAVPVYSNTTAAPYPADPAAIRAQLSEQVAQPVRFVDQVEAMYGAGIRVFVETGPGRVLTQLVDKILGDRPHRAIGTDVAGEHGVRRMLLALAELAVAGFDVETDVLFDQRAEVVDLASLPVRAPGWTIDGHLVRTAAGEVVAGSLQPSDATPPLTTALPSADPQREATVLEYVRGLREMVAAQRDVMLEYLGGSTHPAASAIEAAGLAPVASDELLPALTPVDVGPPDSAPTSAAPPRGDELLAVVLQLVADRTGYPTDMLDPDLDLEADLSIDSIKRIEIIGELAERIGLGGAEDASLDETTIEELAQLKSLREIVAWIDALDLGSAADPPGASDPGPAIAPPIDASLDLTSSDEPPALDVRTADADDGQTSELAVPAGVVRHVVTVFDLDAPPDARRQLDDVTVVIADDRRGVADELTRQLESLGAAVTRVVPDHAPTDDDVQLLASTDWLVWLSPLDPAAVANPQAFDARAAFAWWQPAALGRATTLLAVTTGGGTFAAAPGTAPGLGLAGMVKTVARELTDRTIRIVDLDPGAEPPWLASCLADELLDGDGPTEVGYDGPQRVTRAVVPALLDPVDGDRSLQALSSSGSVVLLTGGARGITARVAQALAAAGAGHIELAGRTPLPVGDEDASTAHALDRRALRQVLIGCGAFDSPAEIEAECSRLLAAREVRATMAGLAAQGAVATYHELDVRDADAVQALVGDIQERHGRLDVVIHGAGVLDDRLLRDKTLAGFERVFSTKVDAARALLAGTDADTAIVLFGSVSGVFGNRGQVDYSAANDALDELAEVAARDTGRLVLSVDWGPWAGTGMVTPELEREYERRGVGLIDPDDGVRALLEQTTAPSGPARMVMMRALTQAFGPDPRRIRVTAHGGRP